MPNKNITLPKQNAYSGDKIPILETKIEHCKLLIRWVLEEYKDFYQDIIENWETKKEEIKIN